MIRFLRKMPILLILVLGIFAVSVAVNYQHQKARLFDQNAKEQQRRTDNVRLYSKISADLGAKENWDELQSALEAARLNHHIDFYVLQYQGHAVWFGEKNDDVTQVDVDYPDKKGEFLFTPKHSMVTTNIGPDYRVTIGAEETSAAFLKENEGSLYKMLTEESIYTLLIVGLVAAWALKDLMLVVREIRRGKRGNLKSLKTKSAESEVFVRGMAGYAQAVSDLEEENRRLGRQVLPSLQKEIHSGKKPPYDFHCTMVRTDINRFSTIYNTYNVTEFMTTINDFFDEVSRTVARYGGLVHEFVGDEVIYYFKDDEHMNSFAVALSAIRDINEIAERFNTFTDRERGYPFTVKSSLAHGKVRFGPLVNGFTVAGSVLIESVRILSYINERDENVIYFDGHHASRLAPVIRSEERLRVTLKGYNNEIALHQYISHEDLTGILKSLTQKSIEKLSYFRSDDHLALILADLREHAKMRPIEVTLKAVHALRAPYISKSKTEFGTQLMGWLAELRADFDQEAFEGAGKILSAVPMLFLNLVPKSNFKTEYRDSLQGLLSCQDRRVVANAVEVLTHFAADIKDRNVMKLRREDLRIAANALVHEGSQDLDSAVMKKLSGLVKSKKPAEIASGLYALGELALIHRTRDMAYYSAQVEFGALVQLLDGFSQHLTTTVRRQALIAARKADDSAVIDRIRFYVKDSGSELLREEMARYLETVAESSSSSHRQGAA